MSKINLEGIASKMSQNQMKNVLGGRCCDGCCMPNITLAYKDSMGNCVKC